MHDDLGAAVEPAREREAAGERGDQRKPEAQTGRFCLGSGPDADAGVPHGHREAVGLGLGLDLERPGISFVGVHDDVHAGLCDDGLQVGDAGFVHAYLLGKACQGVPDDRDVLRFGRERHL